MLAAISAGNSTKYKDLGWSTALTPLKLGAISDMTTSAWEQENSSFHNQKVVKDRIKVNSSFTAYENKEPDTTQEGLESELIYKFSNQKISFLTDFSKSRTDSNGPNSRRPDLSYGIDYNGKLDTLNYGVLKFGLNYRYIGDHIDWTGSKNEFVKSVDLVNVFISKDFFGFNTSLNLSNLLNERY